MAENAKNIPFDAQVYSELSSHQMNSNCKKWLAIFNLLYILYIFLF